MFLEVGDTAKDKSDSRFDSVFAGVPILDSWAPK